MNISDKAWYKFVKSGNPKDYLNYKTLCRAENSALEGRGELGAAGNRRTGDKRAEYR